MNQKQIELKEYLESNMEYFAQVKKMEEEYPSKVKELQRREYLVQESMREFQKIKEGSMRELDVREEELDQKEQELKSVSDKISAVWKKIESTKISNKKDLVNVDDLVKEKHK